MAERTLTPLENPRLETGGGPPPDSDDLGGLVTVGRGLHTEHLPVGGLTVAQFRRRFADRFDIRPENRALIDGERIDDENTVIRAGQQLEFMRNAGEKGASSL